MNESTKPSPGATPGHYGAGYGEQVRRDDATAPPPALDTATDAPAGLEPLVTGLDADVPGSTADDAGAPVVFTPDDVTLPPPDRTPTEAAPASEKVGLIFERS
jgi:hypothetical protein